MGGLTLLDIILIGACLLLVFAPPRYDPAIRIREWLDKQRSKRNDREDKG